MNKIDMKKEILKQVFEANFKRRLKHVLEDIKELQEEKKYVKERMKKLSKKERKRYKKVIKRINHKINKLNHEKQQVPSEGSGIRGDPIPDIKSEKDVGKYIYKGTSKPKTGSGSKRKKQIKRLNEIAKNNKWM